MHRRRTTDSVSSRVEVMARRLERAGEGRERARAVSAWRLVAGTEVFSHARGFALRGDELLIFVDSPVWANELSVLSEHYRVAVNERIGKEAVGSIRFAVSRKVVEQVRHEAEDDENAKQREAQQARPVPATQNEREQIQAMAAGMPPGDLREAVIAAALAHLEWRKGIEARNAAQTAAQRATEPTSQQ